MRKTIAARPLRDRDRRQRQQREMLPGICARTARSRRPASAAASARTAGTSSVPSTNTGTASRTRRHRRHDAVEAAAAMHRRVDAGRHADHERRAASRRGSARACAAGAARSRLRPNSRRPASGRDRGASGRLTKSRYCVEDRPVEAEARRAARRPRPDRASTPPLDSSSSAGSPGTRCSTRKTIVATSHARNSVRARRLAMKIIRRSWSRPA